MNEDFFDNNNSGNEDSSRHFGKSKHQSQERIRELEELLKKIAAEAKAKKMEHESQLFNDLFEMLHSMSFQEEYEDYFTDNQKSSNDFWKFFKRILGYFGIYTGEGDFKTYSMMKEKKEKGWLFSMLNYIGRKIKALVQGILGYDVNLNWKEQLEKEIKELSAKIENGEIVGEALISAMRRLELLRDIKFKFQMFAIGWFSQIVAGFILDQILASTLLSQKQDKQVEKEPLKEKEVATKEVRKNVETEVKVNAREKPQSVPDVNPMRNIQPIKVPVVIKEELTKPSINLFFPMQEQTISNSNSGVQKPKVEEEKKAKPAEQPKKEVCPPKPVGQPKVEVEQRDWVKADDNKSGKINLDSDNTKKPRRGVRNNTQPANNCSNVKIQEAIQQEGHYKC